jgi:hypothetical protein
MPGIILTATVVTPLVLLAGFMLLWKPKRNNHKKWDITEIRASLTFGEINNGTHHSRLDHGYKNVQINVVRASPNHIELSIEGGGKHWQLIFTSPVGKTLEQGLRYRSEGEQSYERRKEALPEDTLMQPGIYFHHPAQKSGSGSGEFMINRLNFDRKSGDLTLLEIEFKKANKSAEFPTLKGKVTYERFSRPALKAVAV